jgi:uncharacterized delta-60 repeat protein
VKSAKIAHHSTYRIIKRVSLTFALLLGVAVLLIYVGHSSAAGGDVDTTFNPGGTGVNGFGGLNSMAVQPDGKIVIGGHFTSYNGNLAGRVMRLNSDGTRDTSFNPGVTEGANEVVLALAVQPDGKIVIGGNFTSYNGNVAAGDFVTRLNADGSLDTTFNVGGAGANGGVASLSAEICSRSRS